MSAWQLDFPEPIALRRCQDAEDPDNFPARSAIGLENGIANSFSEFVHNETQRCFGLEKSLAVPGD